MVYEDFSVSYVSSDRRCPGIDITYPNTRKNVGDVLHEDATFKLQPGLPVKIGWSLLVPQHLGPLLVGVGFFAAKEDALKQVYDVLFSEKGLTSLLSEMQSLFKEVTDRIAT